MEAIDNPKSGTYIRKYESWAEWMQYTAKNATFLPPESCASRRVGHANWAGTETFEEAFKLATHGWAEGRERVKELADRIRSVICSKIVRPEPRFAETGDEVCVGRYLEGEPSHMIEFPPQEHNASGGRIVSIGLNVFVSAGCERALFQMRGAAIVAMIDALETLGYRCELTMCMGCTGQGKGSYQMTVPIKKASEQPEMDRLAFIFSHESIFRRLQFAVGESDPSHACQQQFGIGVYYWTPGKYAEANKHDFFFENMSSSENNTCWKSHELASEEVLRLLKASGLVELADKTSLEQSN
jgi:hypothetical protein